MARSLGCAAWLLVMLGCATQGGLRSDSEPAADRTLTPLEQQLVADAGDRHLDQMDLLDAALIASGAAWPEARAGLRAVLEPRIAAVEAAVRDVADDRLRGQALLDALHRYLLKRYAASASSLIDVAERGEYNCVSATVLYNLIAERVGLIVKAVIIPSHVFALLFTAQGATEVETTAPDGFDPDRSSRAYLAFLVERGLHRTRAALGTEVNMYEQETGQAVEIDNIALVSLILSNRAAAEYDAGDLPRALALAQRAHRLADPERVEHLLAYEASLVNTLALRAADAGDFARALRLLDAGLVDAPASVRDVLIHNRSYSAARAASAQVERGQHAAAIAILDEGLAKDAGRAELHAMRAAVYSDWGFVLEGQGRYADAEAVYRRAIAAEPDEPALLQNYAATLYNHALERAHAGDCAAVSDLARRAGPLGLFASDFEELRRQCSAR
ncbi:MAG: tetratricopeptide repeat protein [Deltaproteobacteria bacterium]|nr:tetratricopeptide repeat protein [Deltaproteobacteria bacterium]